MEEEAQVGAVGGYTDGLTDEEAREVFWDGGFREVDEGAAWDALFTDSRPDDIPFHCCRHHHDVEVGGRCP